MTSYAGKYHEIYVKFIRGLEVGHERLESVFFVADGFEVVKGAEDAVVAAADEADGSQ